MTEELNQEQGIWLDDGRSGILLPVEKPMSVTVTASTERDKGLSVVGFLLEGEEVLEVEPFDSLARWHFESSELTFRSESSGEIEGCSIRECRLDLRHLNLYVGIYTPFPAQQVRHWFGD